MKRLLIFLFFIPFVSFGQSQIVNNINLNAPEGFKKVDDLHWNKGNENVIIQYFKGNIIDITKAKSSCEKGSRASNYLEFNTIEIGGVDYHICIQEGDNTLLIASTQVYKNGYTYMIMVTTNPDDYDAIGHLLGYMITRIKTF